MKPWQIKVTRFFHLSLEMVFLFLLIIPLYSAENKELPIFSFTVMVATAIIFYQPFIEKFKTEKVGVLLIPIIALVGISVGFHFFFALILATIVFWRVLYHVKDNDPNEMGLFIATFLVGVAFYLHFFYLGENQIFLIMTLIQFFLVIILKTLKLSFLSTKSSADKWIQMKWQFGSLAFLGGITMAAIFSYQIIYNVFTFFFKQLFYVIWLLGVPFVYLASLLNFKPRRKGPEDESGFFSNRDDNKTILEEATTSNFDILPWIAGIVILLIILYLIFKKSGSFMLSEYIKINDKEEVSLISQTADKTSWFRRNRPKNEIRRLFYEFEKFMAKQGGGRKYNETVEDWFTRIHVNNELKHIITKTYQSVRYGEKEISKDDRDRYRQALKELKKGFTL